MNLSFTNILVPNDYILSLSLHRVVQKVHLFMIICNPLLPYEKSQLNAGECVLLWDTLLSRGKPSPISQLSPYAILYYAIPSDNLVLIRNLFHLWMIYPYHIPYQACTWFHPDSCYSLYLVFAPFSPFSQSNHSVSPLSGLFPIFTEPSTCRIHPLLQARGDNQHFRDPTYLSPHIH